MKSSHRQVVTRMAPSPTGNFHIGGARTSLYNYLFAKQHGGKFILRIEDTDPERSEKKFEKNIFDTHEWLGLHFDELYRQSERTDLYIQYLDKLIAENKAYEAEDNQTGDGKVIRLRNPGKVVTFSDLVLGEISVDTTDLGDFVIARSRTSPIYHFVVVVDDYEMNVSHVIRGSEHANSTPRQLLILEALGAPIPTYAHISLILAPDGKKKLSKRDNAVSVSEFRDMGYLPEAVNNFLAFIGWNPGGEKEVYTMDELVEAFDLSRIQKGGGAFNQVKLDWFNREHLNMLSDGEFLSLVRPYLSPLESLEFFSEDKVSRLLSLLRERTHVFGALKQEIIDQEYDYFFSAPTKYDQALLHWRKSTPDIAKRHLQFVQGAIESLENDWTMESIKSAIWEYAEEHGKGDVLWPLRYALTGREKSSDPFTVAWIIGKEQVLARVAAVQKLL